MVHQPHKQTPYDQFNFGIPQKFPKEGISATAANAIVNSETWTDANPMLNLSSFVTTFCEPEEKIFTIVICIEISPIPTCIHTRRRRNSGVFNGCTTYGMAQRTQSPMELRPSALPRPVCWPVWRTNGIGGRLDRRQERMPIGQTW